MTTCGYVLTFQISPPTERQRIRLIEGLHIQRGRSREVSTPTLTQGGPKFRLTRTGWWVVSRHVATCQNIAAKPRKLLCGARVAAYRPHVATFLLIKKSSGLQWRHNATLYRVVIIWKKLKMEKDSGPTLAFKKFFFFGILQKVVRQHVRSVKSLVICFSL